LSREFIRTI